MNILVARPPNYADIVKVFPEASGHGVVFSWGPALYNPTAIEIPQTLLAHEKVHGDRQGMTEASIRRWWEFYMRSPEFRLAEEIIGHHAEYRMFCRLNKDRQQRPRVLDALAGRLSGPLYGNMISFKAARKLLV